MNVIIGLLIPLAGTILGAACVFFMKGQMNSLVNKALLGFASGVMIAASIWSLIIPALTIIFSKLLTPAMPYLLSFAAGAMIYVVVEELIPESSVSEEGHYNIGTIGFAVGFILMMILDVALS